MIWETLKALFSTGKAAPDVFKPEWIALLETHVPLYRRLPQQMRLLLHDRMAQFISRVRFQGCGGLELTEEMIISVSSQACLLTLHRHDPPYPKLQAVYLYPSTFSSVQKRVDALGIVTEGVVHRLGESWGSGTVILAWDAVTHGARDFDDGQNVTFHEFAHQLDHEDGPTDGAPSLPGRAAYQTWARVFRENYSDFLNQLEAGDETEIDSYGATNPAEFFAVATETFLEKPHRLYQRRPALYQELKTYFGLDPREWLAER